MQFQQPAGSRKKKVWGSRQGDDDGSTGSAFVRLQDRNLQEMMDEGKLREVR